MINIITIRPHPFCRLEMDAQLKELRLAEKDLSVKQHELDEREKVLKEREKEFTYQLQQRLSTGRSRV